MKRIIGLLGLIIGLMLAAQVSAQFPTDTVYDKPLRVRIGNDESYIYPLDAAQVASETIMIPIKENESGATELSANVYYAKGGGQFPVIMSLTAYNKDIGPSRYISTGRGDAFRAVGLNLGDLTVSNVAAFEGADPGFWVPKGYAVVIVDAPGTGGSPGHEDPFGIGTVDAFKQAIEWVARGGTDQGPTWSNGKVATQGTSYLGIIQWIVASQQPEGLDAINVWQGSSDIIRDDIYNGGIQETAFIPFWLAGKSIKFQDVDTKPTFGMSFNDVPYELVKDITDHTVPTVVDVENIQVPALIAATWSTQGLHSRGSFEGYRRLDVENTGRVPRYLYTHGREEWTVSTSDEAMQVELEFFDCYLKEDRSACSSLNKRPARIEVMHGDNVYHDRVGNQWPIADTEYKKFYLDAPSFGLVEEMPEPGLTQYVSDADMIDDHEISNPQVVFSHTFAADSEIIGYPRLRLIASPFVFDPRARDDDPNTNVDMDIFVGLRKRDADGKTMNFVNLLVADTLFSRGWQRASLRKTTDELNGHQVPDYMSLLALDEVQHLRPGMAYQLDIEILPTAIFFEEGSTLELIIKGSNITLMPNNQHTELVNLGSHTIYTGGSQPGNFDIEASYLELPVVDLGKTPEPVSKGSPLPPAQ